MSIEIITAGLTGAASGGLITFLLKTWFTTRIENSVKHEYDKKLEKHKQLIEQNASVANFIHATNINRTQVSYQKSIDAIDNIWKGLLEINNNKPYLLTYSDLLADDEFGTSFGTCDIKYFSEIDDADITKMISDSSHLEQYRLHCGENLWATFFMYRQLVGRVSILIQKGRAAGNVPHWWKDSICVFIIESILNQKEKDEFFNIKLGKLNWLMKKIEMKFLASANKIIVGDESISHEIKRSAEIISQLESKIK